MIIDVDLKCTLEFWIHWQKCLHLTCQVGNAWRRTDGFEQNTEPAKVCYWYSSEGFRSSSFLFFRQNLQWQWTLDSPYWSYVFFEVFAGGRLARINIDCGWTWADASAPLLDIEKAKPVPEVTKKVKRNVKARKQTTVRKKENVRKTKASSTKSTAAHDAESPHPEDWLHAESDKGVP